jgi:hypothetical protein
MAQGGDLLAEFRLGVKPGSRYAGAGSHGRDADRLTGGLQLAQRLLGAGQGLVAAALGGGD